MLKTESNTTYRIDRERSDNVIGSRIKKAREDAGYTLAQFGELLARYGVTSGPNAINKWELGATVPNAYQLIAIAYALDIRDMQGFFSSVAPSPRLNEIGMRKLREYEQDLLDTGKYTPYPLPSRSGKIIEMPVANLAVSAGTGEFLDDDAFEKVSIPAEEVPSGADFGVRINGDSMEPAYHDGQLVWVQRCSRVPCGQIGIFVYDGEGYIKEYGEQIPEDPAAFTDSYGYTHPQSVLISLNQAYPPKPVSPDLGFRVIGKVLS